MCLKERGSACWGETVRGSKKVHYMADTVLTASIAAFAILGPGPGPGPVLLLVEGAVEGTDTD